jgi:hypothetical protein
VAPSELVIEARVRRWRVLDQPWIFVFLMIGSARGLLFEAWIFAALAIAMLLLLGRYRWRPGVLGATREGLTMDGKPFAPWSRVTAVVQAGASLLIRCRRHGLMQTIACELEVAAAARRFEELAQRRVRLQAIDLSTLRVLWLVVLFMFAAVASLEYPLTAVALFAAIALVLVLVPRPVALFGTDGILARGNVSRRFTRADRIADCRALGPELVRVERVGRAPLDLRLPAFPGRLGEEYALAIQRRVLELRAASPELSEAQHGVLRRGDRSLGEWLAALRDPARAAHRGALPRALLWQVADAPGPEEERAAALAALGPTLDPDERARVSEIGRALVSRRLRLAVDAVLGGDDRQIEHALDVASAAAR